MNTVVQTLQVGNVKLAIIQQSPAPRFGYVLGTADGVTITYDGVSGYTASFMDEASGISVLCDKWFSAKAAAQALETKLLLLRHGIARVVGGAQ